MGEHLVWDVESDDLLPGLTRLWTIPIGTAEGTDVTVYADQPGYAPLSEGLARLSAAERLIGHNVVAFDYHAVNKVYPGTVRREQLWDTLVAARLLDPEERQHSLRAWGGRLGIAKGDYTGDFKSFTEDLVTYAIQDVHVTRAVYRKVREVETWGESFALEMDTAWAIDAQVSNGFCFNVEGARKLDGELRAELDKLQAELQAAFPPITHHIPYTPKATNRKMGYVKGQTIVKTVVETFNPASRKHVGKRLMALGWKPTKFGANGDPTVDEGTIAGLKIPQAAPLVAYFKTLKRLGQLADGDQGWLKVVTPAGRIHGYVNPNGACTGRMSHARPNVAQADKDPRMRALFGPRRGWKLVGCDAEGLEARMLGHYLARYDGGAFSERVVNGKKEDRTDVHSANLKALVEFKLLPDFAWTDAKGFKIGRDGAKTILYALMYGAGDRKLGATLHTIWRDLVAAGCPGKPPKVPVAELGKMVRKALARSMVGLDKLTARVAAVTKQNGYLIGLDGRHLAVRSEHSALNTLLQGGGAIVMKKALQLFMRCQEPTMGEFWALCANVHDEVQMEVVPSEAELYGSEFAGAIKAAGIGLNVRCPLAGDFAVGENWSQTH
jgi:DNA polymerase-1